MEKHDLIIVGAGAAGLTAGLYAARSRIDTLLLEKMAPGGQTATTLSIENYPGFPEGITPVELMENFRNQASRFGARFQTDEASGIESRDGFLVVKGTRDDYSTRTVIIATGSNAALMDTPKKDNPGADPGGMAYAHSKRALANYVHDLATELAPLGIRANVIHPTNCNTPMLQSEPMYRTFRPDLEHPTRADAEPVFRMQQAMKVPYVEPEDISNAVLWLASDEARYVTGMQLRVDAGGYLKWYDYRA